MDILSIRILLRPGNLDRSRRLYRDILSLAVSRESGPPDDPWMVFFPGQGLLEVCGHAPGRLGTRSCSGSRHGMSAPGLPGWPQPACGHPGAGRGTAELIEMQIEDTGGVRIVPVEVPRRSPSPP